MSSPPARPYRPPTEARQTRPVLPAVTPSSAGRAVLSKPPPSQPAPLPPGVRGRGMSPQRGRPTAGAGRGRGGPPRQASPQAAAAAAWARGRGASVAADRGARNSYRSSTMAGPMESAGARSTAVPLPPARESRTKSLSRASRSATVDGERDVRVANRPDPTLEPPATVIVHVPEHELRLEVQSFERYIVDDFLDEVFEQLASAGVALKGDRAEVNKEYYGLFLPSHNTWCRNFKKVADYGLWSKGQGTVIAELRLKTKFKEKKQVVQRPSISQRRRVVLTSTREEDVARRKRLPLTLPELGLAYQVECDPATTAQKLLDYIVAERPALQDNIAEYAIQAKLMSAITPGAPEKESVVILKNEDKLGKLGRMKNLVSLEAKRVSQTVNVVLANGTTKQFSFHPDRTMLELMQYIITTERLLGKYDKACLYYQPQKGAGMIVDTSRTLRSYRMTNSDKLELVHNRESKMRKSHNPSVREKALEEALYIKVECKEFNCQRTLKLNPDATVAEAIYHFSKKVNAIRDPGLYGLFPFKGDKQLEPGRTLASYRTPNMAEMFIRRHNLGVANTVIFKRATLFGVDPSTLEMVDANSDYGPLKIPKVLVDLQKALLAVRGLDVEGIFSIKGNEKRMHEIEEQLTAETFPEKEDYSTYDAHDVAGTIKAWFGRLPSPVLSKLDDDDLAMCAIDEEECIEVPGLLPEPEHSIFIWLLELLFEVCKNSKVNEMESHAIGRAWAPFLLDRPKENVRRALLEQQAKNILSHILENLLSEWGMGVHGGSASRSAFANMRNMRQSGFIMRTAMLS